MSRELRRRERQNQQQSQQQPQNMKDTAKVLGSLGQSLQGLTGLYYTSPEDWANAVFPIVQRMNDIGPAFESKLETQIEHYETTQQQQRQTA